jgi:hypothetical protein
MNAFAIFAVNEHLEFLLDEAAERRAREARQPRRRGRIGRIIDSINRSIDRAVVGATTLVPVLTDYPYKS